MVELGDFRFGGPFGGLLPAFAEFAATENNTSNNASKLIIIRSITVGKVFEKHHGPWKVSLESCQFSFSNLGSSVLPYILDRESFSSGLASNTFDGHKTSSRINLWVLCTSL